MDRLLLVASCGVRGLRNTDVMFRRAQGSDRFHPMWTASYQPTISDDPLNPAPWMDVKVYRPVPGTHDPGDLLQSFSIGFNMRPGVFEVTDRPEARKPLVVHMSGVMHLIRETGEMMVSMLRIPWVEWTP